MNRVDKINDKLNNLDCLILPSHGYTVNGEYGRVIIKVSINDETYKFMFDKEFGNFKGVASDDNPVKIDLKKIDQRFIDKMSAIMKIVSKRVE